MLVSCKHPRCKQSTKSKTGLCKYHRKPMGFAKKAFGRWVVNACLYAGTVQILPKCYGEWSQLYKIFRLSSQATAYSASRRISDQSFHVCHLYPVKGKLGIGLLRPKNLIVLRSQHNQQLKNKEFEGIGLYLPKAKKQSKWSVKKGYTEKQVVNLITRYCGKGYLDFLNAFKAELSYISSSKNDYFFRDIAPTGYVLRRELERFVDYEDDNFSYYKAFLDQLNAGCDEEQLALDFLTGCSPHFKRKKMNFNRVKTGIFDLEMEYDEKVELELIEEIAFVEPEIDDTW